LRVGAPAPGARGDVSVRRRRLLVRGPAGGDGAPIGRIFVRWDAPDGDVAVHRVGWDAANGGTERALRRAVAQLRAGPLG
jgi:hypothetical protein